MKINSQKLMIVLLVTTSVLLVALLIYGGFALGKNGGASSDSISRPSHDTGGAHHPATDAPVPDPDGSHPATIVPISSERVPEHPARSGRIEAPDMGLLHLVLYWETLSRTQDTAKVRVTVKISTHALSVSERKGCPLEVLGKTYYYDAPDIEYSGDDRTEIFLGEQVITMPLVGGCGSAEVSTSWQFRGEYSGVAIDKLPLDGFIEIKD